MYYCHVCCSKPAHGIHFGVETCRACAAFYRRAVHKNYQNLKCRKDDNSCEKRLESCKKCRLTKCLKVGMTDKNLQYGRDLSSSTEKSTLIFITTPHFETNKRSFIDFTKLIERASSILKMKSQNIGISNLEKLANALKNSSKTPRFVLKIGKDDLIKAWEMNFLKVAEWFTHCHQFQELPLNMRVEFLKVVWFTWSYLQTLVLTANRNLELEGKDKLRFFVDGSLVDEDTFDLDMSWMTKFRKEHFYGEVQCFKRTSVIQSIMSLQPTFHEIAYMHLIHSFRRAAKLLNGEFEALNENMINILGEEIHKYYIDEMKSVNYAYRISKIGNIVNTFEKFLNEEMDKIYLGRIFDNMIVDFSHPEFIFGRK